MKQLLIGVLASAALMLPWAAKSAEVAGVKLDDKLHLGNADLVLNGAGLRSRMFFKVYVVGLYLPEKKTTAEAVLAVPGAKHLQIVTLRELSAEQFAEALVSNIEKNHSATELAPLKTRVEEFRNAVLSINTASKGAVITLDYTPENGTRFAVNGEAKGKDIAGEDFYRALLKIWLGNAPVQDDLKDALLGKPL